MQKSNNSNTPHKKAPGHVHIVVFAALLSVVTALTGCKQDWTRETYFPSETSFVFNGVEQPPSTMQNENGLHDVYVYFDQQSISRKNGRTLYKGPYAIRAILAIESDDFDHVSMTKFEIVIPGQSSVVKPYRTTVSHQLTFERWFWYTHFHSDSDFSPEFDQVPEFFVDIEYEYRDSRSGRIHQKKRVLKFQSLRHSGTTPAYPTT